MSTLTLSQIIDITYVGQQPLLKICVMLLVGQVFKSQVKFYDLKIMVRATMVALGLGIGLVLT